MCMIFAHCIGDYTLQGDFLSSAKRKNFWLNNNLEKKDVFAYLAILCVHAFIWSFCINLPITILLGNKSISIVISFFINFIVHAFIELLHLIQIVITFILFVI